MELDAVRAVARDVYGAQGLRRIPVAIMWAAILWPSPWDGVSRSAVSDLIALFVRLAPGLLVIAAAGALQHWISRYYDTRFGHVRVAAPVKEYPDRFLLPTVAGILVLLFVFSVSAAALSHWLERRNVNGWLVIALAQASVLLAVEGWVSGHRPRPHLLALAGAILAVPFVPHPWPAFPMQAMAALTAGAVVTGGVIDHRAYVRRLPPLPSPAGEEGA